MSDFVKNLNTGFGTEVANLQTRVDALATPKSASGELVVSDTKADDSDEVVDSSGDTKKDLDGPSVQNADTVPTESAEGDGTSEA